MNQNILTTLFVRIDVDNQFNVVNMMNFSQTKLDSLKAKNDAIDSYYQIWQELVDVIKWAHDVVHNL